MNESEIIQRYFIHSPHDQSVSVGIGDDAAVVVPPAGEELVITTDSMVEGTHFLRNTNPYFIGYKLMAINLSDLAAMGAKPMWATLNLTLCEINEDWLDQFSQGFFNCANKFEVTLIGGNLAKGGQTNATVQLTGSIPKGSALKRTGAASNDLLFVTGQIGLAAFSLQRLSCNQYDHDCLSSEQIDALYCPVPRIEFGIALREIASSVIDISDGLLHELQEICNANQLGSQVISERIPLATGVDLNTALTGGDDYELLFTANKKNSDKIHQLARQYNVQVTQIGEMNSRKEIELFRSGERIPVPLNTGFDHFSDE